MAEVPLAERGGFVAILPESFGDGHFGVADTGFGIWSKGAEDTQPVGKTSREQGGSACGTDSLSDVKVCESDAIGSDLVEIWSGVDSAIGAEVAISEIVGIDENDVGMTGFCGMIRLGNSHLADRNQHERQDESQGWNHDVKPLPMGMMVEVGSGGFAFMINKMVRKCQT